MQQCAQCYNVFIMFLTCGCYCQSSFEVSLAYLHRYTNCCNFTLLVCEVLGTCGLVLLLKFGYLLFIALEPTNGRVMHML